MDAKNLIGHSGKHANPCGQETDTMIAVVGATGNTGRAVVKELRRSGQNPVCIVRNADRSAQEVLGARCQDGGRRTDRPGGAGEGAQPAFTACSSSPATIRSMVEQQNNVLDAALQAGAEYLVRVSGNRQLIASDSESVIGRGHDAIEERLKASGIKWVILRPGLFMQNTFTPGRLDQDRRQDRASPSPPTCRSPSSTCAIPAP